MKSQFFGRRNANPVPDYDDYDDEPNPFLIQEPSDSHSIPDRRSGQKVPAESNEQRGSANRDEKKVSANCSEQKGSANRSEQKPVEKRAETSSRRTAAEQSPSVQRKAAVNRDKLRPYETSAPVRTRAETYEAEPYEEEEKRSPFDMKYPAAPPHAEKRKKKPKKTTSDSNAHLRNASGNSASEGDASDSGSAFKTRLHGRKNRHGTSGRKGLLIILIVLLLVLAVAVYFLVFHGSSTDGAKSGASQINAAQAADPDSIAATPAPTLVPTPAPTPVPTPTPTPAPTPDLGPLCTEVIFTSDAGYSTTYPERIDNIRSAIEKLDGTVIGAGESFSFNRVCGDYTSANGYVDANVYYEGYPSAEKIRTVGGGVSELASHVYRCAVYTNMTIVDHTNHSHRFSNIQMGEDAYVGPVQNEDGTLSTGGELSDLVFTNTLTQPVKISCRLDEENGRIIVQMLSPETLNFRVTLDTDLTSIYHKMYTSTCIGFYVRPERAVFDRYSNYIESNYLNTDKDQDGHIDYSRYDLYDEQIILQ